MLSVLIIEDQALNRLLIATILERAGHRTLEAETGAEGLALARDAMPDVILMDVMLPDMDGLDATRQIKADPQLKDIPVVAVTAFSDDSDARAVLDAGCDGYVTKPVRYKEFLLELERVTAGRVR
jgi:two-component system cell cycle response regulator DivK